MRRAVALAAAITLSASAALAFTTIDYGGAPAKWANARCTMYHDPGWVSYPAFIGELQAALGPWSGVSGSNFRFSFGGTSPSADVRSSSNGNSDVYFDDLSANVYAVTWLAGEGASLRDRDVTFNTDWGWSTGSGPGVDFRSVAIHELGHVLGLGHETNVPAVMQPYYDGFSKQHSLRFDDEEGCRFIYPDPAPPPPPPSDADLVIGVVAFAPVNASSGDEVDVAFSMRNAGTDPTGAFAASVYLTEHTSVTPADRFLGSAFQSSLAPGAVRDGRVTVRLPDVLEPRLFRIGVILDAQEFVGDRDRTNNDAVATRVIQGGGDALVVGPGTRVTGTLLPYGRASFRMELVAGTRLDVRSTIEDGSLELTLVQEDGGATLVQRRRYRKASGRVRVPADGAYLVHLDSQNATVSDYELSIGAKTIRMAGAVEVGRANQIRLPGYRACTVDAQVRSRSDVRPTVEWAGIEADAHGNRKGTRVKLRPCLVPTTGPLVLVLSQGEGPGGAADWRVRMRVPRKGLLIRR